MILLAPWLLTIIAAVTGLVCSINRYPRLKAPRVYLVYCAAAGIIQMFCWFKLNSYYVVLYWTCQLLHSVVLIWVSAEIISVLLPRSYAIWWATACLVIFGAEFIGTLPAEKTTVLLTLSIRASCIGGLFLLLLSFIGSGWTKETKLSTAGVVAVLLGEVIPALLWTMKKEPGPAIVAAIQLGPVAGLVLLGIAGSRKK